MKRKKPDPEKVRVQVEEIRRMMGTEADLMVQAGHPPRLVAYVMMTVAIRLAMMDGMRPDQFAALAADTIGLFCGEKPENHHMYAPLSDDP
jgi:hypothetical protein